MLIVPAAMPHRFIGANIVALEQLVVIDSNNEVFDLYLDVCV